MFPVARLAGVIATSLLTLCVALPNYNPPDVGGPGSSQGSGTRHAAQSFSLFL